MVREFHENFDVHIGGQPALPDDEERELRRDLLKEEYREYREAEDADDLIEIADALGDMACVIYGTAISYGIDLDAVVAEIHRSNMTKDYEPDPAKRYMKGKTIVKGPRFERPDIEGVLAAEQEVV